MFLAEALNERKRLKSELNALLTRYVGAATHKAGAEPIEPVVPLFERYLSTSLEIESLKCRIARTNNATKVGAYPTMLDAVAARERFRTEATHFQEMAAQIRGAAGRVYSSNDTPTVVSFQVDLRKLRAMSDLAAKQARELDAEIQRTNWVTELLP